MNKNLSKAVLVLAVGVMIATGIYTAIINKDDSKIVDISGNRNELEDINVVYQEREGFYKTKEVSISKDGLDVDEYAKELLGGFPMSNHTRKHRDVLVDARWEDSTYEDDKSIGVVNIEAHYDYEVPSDEGLQLVAYIKDKNLKNNKIKSYEIPLDIYFNSNSNYSHQIIPIKSNNELYLVIGIDKNKENMDKENEEIYASKESIVSIYKLNLNDESSKHILTQNISNKDEVSAISNDVSFSYKNNSYMMIERYKKIEDNKFEKRVELLSYNIEDSKFKSIDLPIYNDDTYGSYDYYLEDNKFIFIGENYENKDSVDIYKTIINLDTNEILSNNEKYSIKIEDTNYDYSVGQVRILNDKIYLMAVAYENKEDTRSTGYSPTSINKNYVYVLDEKTKKTLYVGKVYEGNGNINASIVKEEEI